MQEQFSTSDVASMFTDRRVLITGGTGSFGHEFLQLIRGFSCREIRIFSRDELKQEEMRVALGDTNIKFYLGDIRDRDSVDGVMKDTDFVFHAAALKQVPSCEFFPMQAVATNIQGSCNVVQSAMTHGVSRLVVLSTDKAVYPVNAMGMTKALMEKVVQAAARGASEKDTILSTVRYGNVMCSRGSVIPLFMRQILSGKPLTVTVPHMTRFLLPLPFAIELVAFAFRHAQQGNLFVRKSPACTVADLATALMNLLHRQVPLKVIGMRHGEKIYETLASREELSKAEDMGEYFRVTMDDRDLNYGKFLTEGDAREPDLEDYTSHNTERLNVAAIERLLLTLPEIQAALRSAACH